MSETGGIVTGIDVGTECVKVVVLAPGDKIVGRAIVPSRGYFQDCVEEATTIALEEAKVARDDLAQICLTGFGASCVRPRSPGATDTTCHALAAFHHFPEPITVVDIGGREPSLIQVDARGFRTETRALRKCAVGIGTFLMFAARHLDVHPTRLEELAAAADEPAAIGSYCSVFGSSEIIERLRDGSTREEIALGCIQSIATRISEIGTFQAPLVVTGGVPEYFPGVVRALGRLTGLEPRVVPEPILAGALGAALRARTVGSETPVEENA